MRNVDAYRHSRRALACEAIFGVPISELFAGVRDSSSHEVRKRMLELRARPQATNAQGSGALLIAHKLRWLDARVVLETDTTAVS
jgi:hypothetical protein